MTKSFFLILCMTNFLYATPIHIKLSDRIFNSYNKEIKSKKRLYLSGSGGGMMHDVEKVSASYIAFEKLEIKEARKLYVELVEGYLNRYNQDEKIRPYLHNYPFTVGNLKVDICFENEKRRFIDDGHVALMFVDKHQILVYYAYDHKTDDFVDLYEEPYETAREIVMRENQSDANAGSRSTE